MKFLQVLIFVRTSCPSIRPRVTQMDKRLAWQDHHPIGLIRLKHLPSGYELGLRMAQSLKTDSCIKRLKIVQTIQLLPDSWYPRMNILSREVAVVPQILRDRYHSKVLVHAW